MTLSLHTLKPNPNAKKAKKYIGRGLGSKGTYSGRGVKGQRARSGGGSGLKLKGFRKIMLSTPKLRGFTSKNAKAQIVQVGEIGKQFVDGAQVNPKQLLKKGLIANTETPVKILGTGTIAVKILISECLVSASAKQKIEQAGGTIV